MEVFTFNGKKYFVDPQGFLKDFEDWDKNFANGIAVTLGIKDGLKESHWNVIHFVRAFHIKTDMCPLVYEVCKANGLHLKDLKELFQTGYLRGVCKLAGITYKESNVKYSRVEALSMKAKHETDEKVYRVDIHGFLVDHTEWDPKYAIFSARDMKIKAGLTDKHWKLIDYLRNRYEKTGVVPRIFETCEANQIDLDELEELFPDGYHRGAVKIAGLRVR